MKLICISDTHEQENYVHLPEGDVLIHSGDLTNKGTLSSLEKVAKWFQNQPFKHKICIFGNHELGCSKEPKRSKAIKLFEDAGVHYLENSELIIDGVKFYGSPATPWFHSWEWNYNRGDVIAMEWNKIPDDTNVLITHGPPYGILDLVEDNSFNKGRDLHQGCEELAKKVKQLPQLKAHVFGHLHFNGSQIQVIDGITFGNAAICTEEYYPTNKPLVIEV